jgi:hypothetical protein
LHFDSRQVRMLIVFAALAHVLVQYQTPVFLLRNKAAHEKRCVTLSQRNQTAFLARLPEVFWVQL